MNLLSNQLLTILMVMLITILSSCSSGGGSNSNSSYNEPQEAAEGYVGEEIYTDEEPSFEIKIGDKSGTATYELRSSDAMKSGSLTTTLGIYQDAKLYDEYALDLTMIMNQKLNFGELKKGTYPIRSIFSSMDSRANFFGLSGNVVDEQTYQNMVGANLLEDYQESFVLLSDKENSLIIESASPLEAEEEENAYYENGSQMLTGKLEINFMQISSNKEIKVSANFKMQHDWALKK